MSKLDKIEELLVKMDKRLTAIEDGRTSRKRKKGNGKTKKLKELADVFTEVDHPKYRMVGAWYQLPDQEKPEFKKFYGLTKMRKHDWYLLKQFGSFQKFTDIPNVDA